MRERFRLKQFGEVVAWAEGAKALDEIQHYQTVYNQDGPCMIEYYVKGKWKKFV